MKFYRYSQQRHTDSLLASGQIRIGTLHDFRSSEHKRGVADPMEGRKQIFHHVSRGTPGGSSIDDRSVDFFGMVEIINSTGCSVRDSSFTMDLETSDCFILCGSLEHSRSVAEQFDDADSCVEILDIRRFSDALSERLAKDFPIDSVRVCPITYIDKKENWNGIDRGLNPAILKEREFEGQKEFRIIWELSEPVSITPIILYEPKLLKYIMDIGVPT
jgi:hypothetical protein